MLSRLFIKNYALIDNLDISFAKGLNIITGETGAGKSILMGALSLILGNRAEGKQFFDESKKCVIEGYFTVRDYGLRDFFSQHDLDYEEETIIRRELSVDGKSRSFVNDSPVTLSLLKQLGEQLIDIHSQHATLQINTEDFQLFVLDNIAGNEPLLVAYKDAYKWLRQQEAELRELKEHIDALNVELDYNQFLFDELDKLQLEPGEVDALENEQQQLENAEEIKRALFASQQLLSDADQNVQQLLKDAVSQVRTAGRYFNMADTLADRLESVYIEIKDISAEIADTENTIVLDEQRLDDVNTRLSEIYTLLKKHRVDTDLALIAIYNMLEEKLRIVSGQDERLSALEKSVLAQRKEVLRLAIELSNARQKEIAKVEQSVAATLQSVGMPNAQLYIELLQGDESQLSPKGLDKVQYLFSANKGQALQPIHKVASGGEQSRVMLAIKSLVAKSMTLPTIVFDEIDTGISGEVALRVGEVMEELGQSMQVIAISHLPQIASKGDAHFKVYKEDLADKTRSNIQLLGLDERIKEIAQMLSGTNPGEAALQHAKELLER